MSYSTPYYWQIVLKYPKCFPKTTISYHSLVKIDSCFLNVQNFSSLTEIMAIERKIWKIFFGLMAATAYVSSFSIRPQSQKSEENAKIMVYGYSSYPDKGEITPNTSLPTTTTTRTSPKKSNPTQILDPTLQPPYKLTTHNAEGVVVLIVFPIMLLCLCAFVGTWPMSNFSLCTFEKSNICLYTFLKKHSCLFTFLKKNISCLLTCLKNDSSCFLTFLKKTSAVC